MRRLLAVLFGRPAKRGQNLGPSGVKVRPPKPQPIEVHRCHHRI